MAPLVRRTWSPRGVTPLLYQCTRSHKRVSAIAALCITPDKHHIHLYFRLHPDTGINAGLVADFLRQLKKQLDAPIVLLWDRLTAHRAKSVQSFLCRSYIPSFFFPPYAPELNPTEYVWAYLKINPLANLAITNLDTLADITRHHGRSIQRKEKLLHSFVNHSPLSLRLK